jgi:hypothetical protein
MTHHDLDDVFGQSGHDSVDPALLGRISQSIGASLRPVRPLPASWILIATSMAACVVLAVAGGVLLGLYGVGKLSPLEIATIFPTLALLIWLAASTYVSERIPGSRRWASLGTVFAGSSLMLIAIFALLFRNYHTDHFVSAGLTCLKAGVLQAIPVALAGWLVLRRGFAVNPRSAGLALGVFSGLAGVTMLELHCPNFQMLHVTVWHTAVIPVSACAVALFVAMVRRIFIPPFDHSSRR